MFPIPFSLRRLCAVTVGSLMVSAMRLSESPGWTTLAQAGSWTRGGSGMVVVVVVVVVVGVDVELDEAVLAVVGSGAPVIGPVVGDAVLEVTASERLGGVVTAVVAA